MKMQYRPMSCPDTLEAAYAAEALLDLSTCNHKKILDTAQSALQTPLQ